MSPYNIYHDVTQYIEDEAFRGRSVNDVIAELRRTGWSEAHITAAVGQLNQQHDVLEQIDLDPLHRKQQQRRSLKVIGLSVIAGAVIALALFALFVRKSTTYLTFNDPNFTMQVPSTWAREDSYTPGASVIVFYSGTDVEAVRRSGAAMTLYLNLFEDSFGRQLIAGDSRVTVLRDETRETDGVVQRLIEYQQPGTIDAPLPTRGMYMLSTKGQLTVSATIAAGQDVWGDFAGQAERTLWSITPNCSIKNLDALYDENGAIILCQPEE